MLSREQKLTVATIAGVVVSAWGLIAVVLTISSHYSNALAVEAMKQGYSQQALPGQMGVYWVKDGRPRD